MIKNILKTIVFITFIINIAIIFFLFFIFESDNLSLIQFSKENFLATDLNLIVFGLIYTFFVSLNIPLSTFITIICGALFGPIKTFFILLIASPAGSTIAFTINRFFFKDLKKIDEIKKKIKLDSKIVNYKTILFFKIFPLVPFSWINILSSSFKNITTLKYFIVNLFGCPLNILLFSNLGEAIYVKDVKKIAYVLLVILFFFLTTLLIKKYYFKKI